MYDEARAHFINSIVNFQNRMGISQKKMAAILNLTPRTYERFITGVPIQRELELYFRVAELSGQSMYQLTGLSVSQDVENTQLYLQLNESNRRIADGILRVLIKEQYHEMQTLQKRGHP